VSASLPSLVSSTVSLRLSRASRRVSPSLAMPVSSSTADQPPSSYSMRRISGPRLMRK
jgi:hypothetical protein